MTRLVFPEGFLWGTATSAYQIEGAGAGIGGRGECVWDRFAAEAGRVSDGSNGSIACDHAHRWPEDVELMGALGLDAYRFSIGWSRVLPTGRGKPVGSALDFYDALVDKLLGAGIRPFVTLNHWDLPHALQDEGGWSSRDTCGRFVEYAHVVASRLGDRVHDFATHNEPWCMAHLGWQTGEHAPGLWDPPASLRVAHHLLLSHGQAIPVIRSASHRARVGIALIQMATQPASQSAADVQMARQFDGFFNRWYLDPLYRGTYPQDAIADRGFGSIADMDFVQPGDMEVIATPTDYLGINYYTRTVLRAFTVAEEDNEPATVIPAPQSERTEMGWEVYPRGLHDVLLRVHRDYAPPRLYVTEFGAAFRDQPDAQGFVDDQQRIAYLRDHLIEAHRAIAAGVPLRGVFAWSLLDNWEWQHGFTKRFGLVRVDYETQRRTPKASARWYRQVAEENAVDGG